MQNGFAQRKRSGQVSVISEGAARDRPTFALRATVGNLRVLTGERRLVDQTGARWNQLVGWLHQVAALRGVAS